MKAQGIALGLTRKTVASPRREVNQFPSGAGYAGPGFHTWPSGHVLQDTDPNPLLRSRSPTKKSFGEAFGAATGVSDPRLQKRRSLALRPLAPAFPVPATTTAPTDFFSRGGAESAEEGRLGFLRELRGSA